MALLLLAAGPVVAQGATTDYDTDDDGLIDVSSQAQLAAITHDLNGDGDTSVTAYGTAFPQRDTTSGGRMGCPSGTCTGYELSGNVTLSGAFTPIGAYTATFEGNGNTISGLSVTASSGHAGLFTELGASGVIRNVGLTSPTITVSSGQSVGGLAGLTAAGSVISASYVSGGAITVSANNSNAGGLVGYARGIIRAGYASATVAAASGNPSALDLGGLVGHLEGGTIIASYASGTVTPGLGTVVSDGLLVGRSTNDSSTPPNSSTITNSYCAAAGDCIGGQTGGAVAAERQTASAMQTPTDYTGIYLNWNIDLDADGGLDYPWNFGTTSAYPTLNTLAQRTSDTPSAADYDADDAGLIDISTIALLNAMRWDPDGDGDPQTVNYSAYGTAFGGRTHTADAATGRMGCPPADGCSGYELTASLTFPTSGRFSNWAPILDYASAFEGNGFTLTGLNISITSAASYGPSGLFEELTTANGLIRNVGLINPTVSTASDNHATGSLVGWLAYNAVIETSYVAGGSVTSSGDNARVGGLVGLSQRQSVIRASYTTAAVSPSGNPANIQVGGLLGYSAGGEIRASYAAGTVTGSSGFNAAAGGLVGRAAGAFNSYPDSYFDTQATGQNAGVGDHIIGSTATAAGHNTETMQRPVTYESIYADWNLDLDGVTGGDNPWNFGTAAQYPTLHLPGQRSQAIPPQSIFPTPPPPARGGGTPYRPASAHPEIYANPRYEMSAACEVRTAGEGEEARSTATLTFDLGGYDRPVTLVLSLWDGQFFRTLQSQGIAMPELRREGQTATVEVATNPAQTRFRIDSQYGLNLVLGYADCRTDDPE